MRSFGNGGYFAGPVADASGEFHFFGRLISRPEIRLVRMDSGRFRVSFASEGDCKIVGVTANGGLDATFGSSGVVTLHGPDGSQVTCNALESDSQGRLLVSGSSGNHGFLARLLAHGSVDPPLAPMQPSRNPCPRSLRSPWHPMASCWSQVRGGQGASIMRLQTTGGLDAAFGDSGQTWIDLKSKLASSPVVRDMLVREDGSVIAVGGAVNYDRPFVVRLMGEAGGTSRGVISFTRGHAAPVEADGTAFVRVRRSGGRDGAVSATYRTLAYDATAPEDFVPESGTLEWAEGDTSDKEIAIGIVEGGETARRLPKSFTSCSMTSKVGPAAELGGDRGHSARRFARWPDRDRSRQDESVSSRNHRYFPGGPGPQLFLEGRVCVTLTAKSGTARAGKDFGPKPVTTCWEDQYGDWQLPNLQLFNDDRKEGPETFSINSNSTGRAIIGPIGSLTVTLHDDD